MTARYAELRCVTNRSFLRGASHPRELVEQAARLELSALAITDYASVSGVVQAHLAAKAAGLPLVCGAQFELEDAPPVVLLASDRAAWAGLCRLITKARRAAPKGEYRAALADVLQEHTGLFAILCPRDEDLPSASSRELLGAARLLSEVFGERALLAASRFLDGRDDDRWEAVQAWERDTGLPLVAVGDVHFHVASRRPLHDVLTAIRGETTVADAGFRLFPNAERRLKNARQMRALFAPRPDLIERSAEIAAACRFTLDELRYEYPGELIPEGKSAAEHLADLAWSGARARYPAGVPDQVAALIRRELALIAELRYEPYFLTVHDLVAWARSRDILCQGRGSAANSAVCYALGITAVDPDRIDVLFERFISRERGEPPDIDVDFEHERREEVFAYLWRKYGRDRAGLAAVTVSYKTRSALRDVGKAMGLSLEQANRLAKILARDRDDAAEPAMLREAGFNPEDRALRHTRSLAGELRGFPRHLSQHPGGFVLTRGRLDELAPIENAAMPERTVIQWDKDDLDALGILKIDCLALGMLTAIRKAFALIRRTHGVALDLATVPPEDADTYAMIQRADTIGVFQIESRAQMAMLPRLKPACFYDLVIEVAIVRPGPIQGGMVHPYLRRRRGEEAVEYPTPEVERTLKKTLGVPLFQEQCMQLAVVAAGFTPGEADQLRRAMAAWRRHGTIGPLGEKLMTGMIARGIAPDFAERVFRQIQGFGEYGFPESHAASFALLVYVSAYLKRHYPACFTAALLNSQPMGFYAPAQLVRDARDHGVDVRPACVQRSDWDAILEDGGALRLGMSVVKGVRREALDRLIAERALHGPFRDLEDLRRRVALDAATLEALAEADALAALRHERREALWDVIAIGDRSPLFSPAAREDRTGDPGEPRPDLPAMTEFDEVHHDYHRTGLTLRRHPLGFLRAHLRRQGVISLADLPHARAGAWVRVAGLVINRQRPMTASGVLFMTLEDESAFAQVVVWKPVQERFHQVLVSERALLVRGRLDRDGEALHVIAQALSPLPALSEIEQRSRDFH